VEPAALRDGNPTWPPLRGGTPPAEALQRRPLSRFEGGDWVTLDRRGKKFDEPMSSGAGERIKGELECMASRRFQHFNAMAFAKWMSTSSRKPTGRLKWQ
jgi:hypothetical protein